MRCIGCQERSTMKLINTADPAAKPSIVMMVYGEGGVGKTTFTSTAPTPILADCEGGSKYFGLRGIKMDVAMIEKWSDMKEFLDCAKSDKFETVIIDPIGELMEKLKMFMIAQNDSKLVQKSGDPTMAGWGWLKQTMRNYLKVLRDSGKHVILVAHLDEKMDEDRMVKRPMIATKLSDELVNMVDVVAYMTMVTRDGETKRVLIVDPENDKYTAKDRTGQLGKYIEPDFSKIVQACQGTKVYSWSNPKAKEVKEKKEVEAEMTKTEEAPQENSKEEAQELADAIGGEVVNEETKLKNPHLQAAKDKLNKAKAQ